MPDGPRIHTLSALRPVLRRTAVRVRIQRAFSGLVVGLLAAGAATVLGLTLDALQPSANVAKGFWPAALAVTLGPVVWALLRPVSRLACAGRIDAASHLAGSLTSALELATSTDGPLSPFEQACLGRAARQAGTVDIAEVVPFRWPRTTPWLGLLLAPGLWLALYDPSEPAAPPPEPQPAEVASAPLLHPDDLQAFASEAQDAAHAETDGAPELRAHIDAFNALVEDLAEGTVATDAALERLLALEARLRETSTAELAALADGLRELGQQLGRARVTRSLAAQLRQADPAEAAAAMRALQTELAETSPRAAARRAQALAEALRRAAEPPASSAARSAEQARLQREMDRLLKQRKDPAGEPSEAEERLLSDKRRRLDQLREQAQQEARARRQLERLRQQLAEAAEQLGQDDPAAGEQALQGAGEELERLSQRQRAGRAGQRLAQQVAQLQRLMRAQAERDASGEERTGEAQDRRAAAGAGRDRQPGARLDVGRFAQAARGHRTPPDDDDQTPAPGDSPGGSPKKPSDEGMPVGVSEAQTVRKLRAGSSASAGGGLGDDAPQSGERQRAIDTRGQLEHVPGQTTEGPTRSEVIREAGGRGFASQPYRQVHAQYHKHAENVIERDRVPGGYRFYVRRYFQLIRPRQE